MSNKKIDAIKTKISVQQHRINDILNDSDKNIGKGVKKMQRLFITVISTVIITNICAIIGIAVNENPITIIALQLSSLATLLIFLIEFIMRFISAPAEYTNVSPRLAHLKYLFSFVGLIDILSILPILIPILYKINGAELELHGDELHLYMLFLFTLMIKTIRYFKTFHFIIRVFGSVKRELLLGLIISAILVISSGTLMYYVERSAQPEKFTGIGEGFWWSIMTYATVGYGDIYPITPLGKILASLIAIIGIGTIALPSGIISGAFIREMQLQKQRKSKNKTTIAAPISEVKLNDYKFCPYCGTSGKFSLQGKYCQYCGKTVYNN